MNVAGRKGEDATALAGRRAGAFGLGMVQRILWIVAFAFGGVVGLRAQDVLLQVSPHGDATAGREAHATVFALNRGASAASAPLPERLSAQLSAGENHWTVELLRVGAGAGSTAPGAFAEAEYAFAVPADARGALVLVLTQANTNRVVLDVLPGSPDAPQLAATAVPTQPAAGQSSTADAAKATKPTTSGVPTPAISRIERTFADHFSAHQPVYFIFGPDRPAAKFQFSFKYRLVSDTRVVEDGAAPPLHGVYFAYTQRSLWNITDNSSPFYDSSYMPELFYERLEPAAEKGDSLVHWLGYQAGLMHESNGRDGLSSRSLNIAYVRPMLLLGEFDGWNLIFAPRVFAYVGGLSDNPTMTDYRGHVEWNAFFGKNGNVALAVTGRTGNGLHKGSLQLDLTYPLRSRLGNMATFFLIQYFNGYGEGLLNFDERSETWRAGFSLVR